MNTREMAKEYRLSRWAEIIREREASGLTIREYCRNAGIGEHRYYYGLNKLREAAGDEINKSQNATGLVPASFAEVKVVGRDAPTGTYAPCKNNISVEMPGVRVTADGEYPLDKLAAVIHELAVRP